MKNGVGMEKREREMREEGVEMTLADELGRFELMRKEVDAAESI